MLGLSSPPGEAAATRLGRQKMQDSSNNGNFIVWEMVDSIAAEAIRNSLFIHPSHAVAPPRGVLSLEAAKQLP